MADIELVIKISEEVYEDIKEYGLCGYCSDREIVSEAILNGKPLPKGHGDLVDKKDLSLMTVHLIDGTFVCDAETIIKADKEDK